MNEFLKNILVSINSVIGNYGWSIILFTLLIRLVCMPFDYKSRVGMRKTQKIQPQVNALQKKYGKDQEKLNQKLSELYKKEHINPLSSCLPMLLTLPILWFMFGAMRMVANEHIVSQVFDILQGKEPVLQSWLWIKNIWMPDSPFASVWPVESSMMQITADVWQKAFAALGDGAALLPESLALTSESFTSANLSATVKSIYAAMSAMPAYAEMTSVMPGWHFNLWITTVDLMKHFNGLYILPILAAATQFLMTALQPVQPETQNQTNKGTGAFMKWFFPIFSLWICSGYTSMFAIYWVASNIIAAAQTFVINKILDRKEAQATISTEGSIK